MKVRVSNTLDDLTADLRRITTQGRKDMADVVRHNAHEGNRLAKAFASEQHTMFGDEDIDYPPSFTTERITPLIWEYGPDADIGDGSKASGYEFGSINSPPHYDLARSVDIIGTEFELDVQDMTRGWFWPNG